MHCLTIKFLHISVQGYTSFMKFCVGKLHVHVFLAFPRTGPPHQFYVQGLWRPERLSVHQRPQRDP